jgi:molecular chaperone HscB
VGAANRLRFDDLTQDNHFELFGLVPGFDIDLTVLEAQWKARVAQVHPDRFASAGPAEKRVAMQWSARLNGAYRILRDPLQRAQYLCELAGQAVGEGSGHAVDMAFLEQQMAWREHLETLESSRDTQALPAFTDEILADRQRRIDQISTLFEKKQWSDAVGRLHEWMFIEKFLQEIQTVKRALASTE